MAISLLKGTVRADERFRLSLAKLQNFRSCRYLAMLISDRIYRMYNCCIAPSAEIDESVEFPHPSGIVVGEGVRIGADSVIYQQVTLGRRDRGEAAYPIVGKRVVIYAGAKIIGGITIGDGAIIGANAVVTHDVPAGAVVAGVPARIIRGGVSDMSIINGGNVSGGGSS